MRGRDNAEGGEETAMADTLNAKVLKKIVVTPGLMILRVAPVAGELPPFTPGQFALLGLPGSAPRDRLADDEANPPDPDEIVKRSFSIASSSRRSEYLEFYITMVRSGQLTPRLYALTEGDRLFLSPRCFGVCTIDKAPAGSNIVLIATGTGLAPHMSMIRSDVTCYGARKFAVLHGAYHSWELGYRDELETLGHHCVDFHYQPIISNEDGADVTWRGPVGYVQRLWEEGYVERSWGFAPTPANTDIFIAGHPRMVESVSTLLQEEGFAEPSAERPDGQIHVERFWDQTKK